MKFCCLFIFLIALSLNISDAYAGAQLDSEGILAIAKVAGACGIMHEMIDFQEKTKLKGGNEFVSRFWKMESARRGMSEQEVFNQCDFAINSYEKFKKSLEKEVKK